MEPLITVKDVKDRYKCSGPTARKYIRQCNPHMESPLGTPEWAFREWESGRVVTAGKREKAIKRLTAGRVIVPRKRG